MIVDANVLVSAILGTSYPLIAAVQRTGHDLLVPAEQYREARLNGIKRAAAKGLDGERLTELVLALVDPVEWTFYGHLETAARERLDKSARAQKDWPLLALSMATGEAVWSNDRDLFGTGITTWNTFNIRFLSHRANTPGADPINGAADA